MSYKVISKPKVEIDPDLLHKIEGQVHEMGQVVLHFIYRSPLGDYPSMIRIWPTTYLYDQHSDHVSELVHAENITYYPTWHICPPGKNQYFTLIFSGLPRSCQVFDFIEKCTNEVGAFRVLDIKRNAQDVYYIMMG